MARHYEKSPFALAFELWNEPHGKATAEVVNRCYREAIWAIREVDGERILIAGPAGWNSVKQLKGLKLPEEDRRIIVTVHCYEPFLFTHQDAGWANLKGLKGVRFPGPPEVPLKVAQLFPRRYLVVPGVVE